MKKLFFIGASLLLSQHAFASQDYFCVINSSHTSIAQVVAGVVSPFDHSTDLHIKRLKGVSSGDSFIASLVLDEETQSQVLDVAINYSVGDSSYRAEERYYREINVQGARVIRTKGVDEKHAKIPLLASNKTNIASANSLGYGSIKKDTNGGFSGKLMLSLHSDGEAGSSHDNWYSQNIKFECLRAYKVLNGKN